MRIKDWSQIVSFEANVRRPKSYDELAQALSELTQGGSAGKPIRVLGGLHSCSNIFESEAIIITEDIPTTIEYGDDNATAVVSLNWHFGDIMLELSKRGKALNAMGGEDSQTLAGLISTNTAPATSKYGIYELVDWVEYITLGDNGKVVTKRITRDDEAFRAAICSLGAIGILTKAQFRLIDQPYYETIQKIIPLKDVLGDIEKTSERYDFWRINWLQDTDKGLLWAAKEIPRDKADPDGDYKAEPAEKVLRDTFRFLAKLGNGGPLLDSVWKKLIFWILRTFYGETKKTGPLRTMLPVDRYTPLHVAMAEWFFRPEDLSRLQESCRRYFRKNRWANLPIEIELAKTDDYFMSQINFEGLDYALKFNFQYMTDCCNEEEKKTIYTHLAGLWKHLLADGIDFRAHWGKINFMDYDYVRTHYKLDEFKSHIRPEFFNEYLAKRLNPPA